MNKSSIEWTDWTSNPIQALRSVGGVPWKRGWFCEKVSPGCAHCYSATLNQMRGNGLDFVPANRDSVHFKLNEDELAEWSRKRLAGPGKGEPMYEGRCFAFDMTDLFGEWVSDEWLDKIFAAMALAPQLQFQILTKRPERMRAYLSDVDRVMKGIDDAIKAFGDSRRLASWPLQNVWLGVTVENQRWADHRIPILLETPAAVRFVSAEPLLGPVDLIDPMHEYDNQYHGGEWDWLGHTFEPGESMLVDYRPVADVRVRKIFCKLCGNEEPNPMHRGLPFSGPYLDWIIVGGESGPKHRAFDPAWARSIVAQCAEAGVACFVKQLGGARPGNALEDLPEDLRVRQFPR